MKLDLSVLAAFILTVVALAFSVGYIAGKQQEKVTTALVQQENKQIRKQIKQIQSDFELSKTDVVLKLQGQIAALKNDIAKNETDYACKLSDTAQRLHSDAVETANQHRQAIN